MNIGIFSGNRAEFGLLLPLIKHLHLHPSYNLCLFIGGALLNPKYSSLCLDQLSNLGIPITAKIELPEPDATNSTAKSIALGILSADSILPAYNLDAIFIYADRYEGFAMAVACSHLNIPICHIEGGDITNGGAFDDNIRHAITKLSHLHFTSNANSSQVLLTMGEEPWRIQNVGLLPFSTDFTTGLLDLDQLQSSLGISLANEIIIFTMHSISSDLQQTYLEARASFSALRSLQSESRTIILTYPNDDSGSDIVFDFIDSLRADCPEILIIPSLGQQRYYSLLNLTSLGFYVTCLGNSSSIVKELGFFGVPGLLIGSRQLGRLLASNVSCTEANHDSIVQSYTSLISNYSSVDFSFNPYQVQDGLALLLDHLSSSLTNPSLLRKEFHL